MHNMAKTNFTTTLWGVLLGALVLFVACGTATPPTADPAVLALKKSKISAAQQREHDLLFFEALRQKHKGNPDAAYELLTRALEIVPNAPATLYEKGKLTLLHMHRPFLEAVQDSIILAEADSLVQGAYEQDQNNYTYLEMWAMVCLEKARHEQATKLFERMLSLRPKSETMATLAELYKTQEKYDAALSMIARVEDQEGTNPAIAKERVGLLIAMGQKEKALRYIDSLCQVYHNDPTERLNYASKYELLLEAKQVCKIYEDFLRDFPDFEDLQSQLTIAYLRSQQDEKFRAALFGLVKDPHYDQNKKVRFLLYLGKMALSGACNKTLCYDAIYQASLTHHDNSELAELLAIYAEQGECKGDTMAQALKHLLTISPNNESVRMKVLLREVQAENMHNIAQVCAEGVQHHPQQIIFYYYWGIAQRYLEGKEAAAKVWQKAIKVMENSDRALPKDSNVASEIYSAMGDWYYQSKRKTQSYAAYEKALQYDEQNSLCLNNYAYYLTVEKQQLSKALTMAEKAIALDGDNPTVIDTYAWVLYHKKRYAEAREQILHGLRLTLEQQQKTISATVLEHAAAIYSKLGQTNTAQRFRKFQRQAAQQQLDFSALSTFLQTL